MGGGSRRGGSSSSGRGRVKAKSKSSGGNSSSGNPKTRRRGSQGKAGGLFIEGGFLSDWRPSSPNRNSGRNGSSRSLHRAEASASKSEFAKSSGATVGYSYPSSDFQGVSSVGTGNNSEDSYLNQLRYPFIFVDSKQNQVNAHMEQTPPSKPNSVKYTYSYGADFVLGDSSHRGLGFPSEHDKTSSGIGTSSEQMPQSTPVLDSSSFEKDVGSDEGINCDLSNQMTDDLPSKVSAVRNSGFLSIGGLKLYTQDISDDESEDDDNEGSAHDDSSAYSSEPEELLGSSESSDSEETSDSDSDIDEEVAEDYLEGVGGSDNIIDAKWLLKPDLDESEDDSSSSSCYDEALGKLSGISLQEASREYGMKKSQPWKKRSVNSGPLDLDDIMLEKDPRTVYARKKHVSQLPHSWPLHAQKSKSSKKMHGEKKKLREERIAVKRRERMQNRGVDLEKINSKLEQLVLEEVDIFSFQPMHSRDCSQVQRLAGIYQLKSSSQSFGKKRFVTVMRTHSTSMPSSSRRQRLQKLLGVDDKDADFSVTGYMNKKSVSRERRLGNKNAKRNDFRLQELQPSQNKTPKSASRGSRKDKKGSGQKGSYANLPVSFVSSGVIQSETVEVTAVDKTDGTDKKGIGITSSANVGSFEVHTTGFGSKMMAKMGYVEGEGLGKNGQGMAQPIEVIQRPKSLGLGVPATEPARRSKSSRIGTSEKHTRTEPPRSMSSGICAFEKHTKGFGSKMMAKMGFVDGSGLGRDSQGITIPLSAVRRPKSRGLGSKGNDDLIEDFPDAISDMYSKGMTSEVLDRRTSEFTAIHEESSCAYEENPNRISAVELDSDLHTSSMQHTKQILKSDHAIGHGPIMKNIMPEPSQVYSKVATQGLNTYCSEFNWSRSQPGVIPKTFQGHPFTFLKSKTSVSSAPISKPRTWHRSGNNPTTSLPRIKPLAGTAPPKRPILEGKGNFQNTSTSYIRKGNSLVRKPSPVSALSQIFSVNQSPARSESRAGVIDRPMYLKTGETNTTQEGPRTPSLPIDNKSQENITSPLVNPPSSGCCENLSDPSKSIEANYAPKSSEDALKHFETSDNQPGLSNNGESQVEANDGNISSMKARRIVYMKPTTNQLVATSSSCDIVSTDQKGQIAFSNGYYKRSKNQLVRTTFESHINQTIAMPNSNVDSDGRGASKVLCNRRSIKRRSYKVARSSGKPSNASLVWTLCGNNSSRNDSDSLHHQKVLPHLCPWKRTTYLRSSIRNSASSFDSSSSLSAISKKLLLSRKRKTVHTRSTHGVSLWKSKELGVGGYSLKWSKSIEEHSKKANEEATLAAAAVERKKREQEDEACINSQAKRERIFRIGSVRYRMDPSRRTLQRISDDESLSSASISSGSAARRAYVPRRLVIGNDEYVRIGNGNQLIRDPKKRTRKLANEKVRWSLHTARQRFARKQKYCQFFTRFGKCNKDGGKCPYIHDPSKVAVCTKFLNGLCSTPNCKLTHKVIQERMPDCSYFFQGLCTNRNCPYRHVNVNPKASICEGFLKGYCADGNECLKKHSYVCPTFEATGTCVQGTKCKLHHPKKQSKGKKRKRSEDQNSRGRYFGSIPVDVSEPGMMVAASSHQDLDLEKELSDYISLDVNEEVADMVDQSFEHSEFCDNDSMDLQLDTTDELKPVLIITKLASQAS